MSSEIEDTRKLCHEYIIYTTITDTKTILYFSRNRTTLWTLGTFENGVFTTTNYWVNDPDLNSERKFTPEELKQYVWEHFKVSIEVEEEDEDE